jgi:predicted nucleotidyltransferase
MQGLAMLPHASLADIPLDVQALILARLDEIERAERVRIVLAVESGSRAWGFASADSDYDVRFLYVRRVEDYAALTVPRDVIERPIEDALDLSGWDLRKALTLGLRWNPALVEWLTSPIVYREAGWEAAALRNLFARPMGRDALIRHYYGLAQRQFARHVDGRTAVNLKKYFYVVRPAAALLWLELRREETPPMSLPALLAGVALPAGVAAALSELQRLKARTSEFGEGARVAVLDAFCAERIAWARANLPDAAPARDPALARAAAAVFQAAVFGRGPPADFA